jgi:transposase
MAFKAKGLLSRGAVEGLNLKAKLTIRKAYGFKSPECLKIALYVMHLENCLNHSVCT